MKTATLLAMALCVGVMATLAFGQPTTMPSVNAPAAPPVVLVAPFQQLGDSNRAWVGQALQEDLLASVARSGLQGKSTDHPLVSSDTAAAVSAGLDAGAAYVVYGSFQMVGDQIRVNAQTIDVNKGQSIGSLQATGEVRSLFSIEDSLGNQLRPMLPQIPGHMPIVIRGSGGSPYAYLNMTPTPSPNPDGQTLSYFNPTTQPSPNYSDEDQAEAPATNDQEIAYPPYYYGYGYPYYPYGGTIIIINRHFHHDRDHDGDHHHGTWGQTPRVNQLNSNRSAFPFANGRPPAGFTTQRLAPTGSFPFSPGPPTSGFSAGQMTGRR